MSANEWVHVKVELPRDGDPVLVFIGAPYLEKAIASYAEDEWQLDSAYWNNLESYITHWMPLPPSP